MFLGKKNSDASKPTKNLKLNGATREKRYRVYATVSKKTRNPENGVANSDIF